MSAVDNIMSLVRNMRPDSEILAAVKELELQLKERKASYLVACERIEDLERALENAHQDRERLEKRAIDVWQINRDRRAIS
jgi:hypothetical protein